MFVSLRSTWERIVAGAASVGLLVSPAAYAQPTPQNAAQSQIEQMIGSLAVRNAQCSQQVMTASNEVQALQKQVADLKKQLEEAKKPAPVAAPLPYEKPKGK